MGRQIAATYGAVVGFFYGLRGRSSLRPMSKSMRNFNFAEALVIKQ